MGEAKRRAAVPMLISVLIPTRERPDMLDRCVNSILATAGEDSWFEVLVAVDDDDAATNQDVTAPCDPHVRYLVWPRPMTLGEKLNKLAAEAKGDVFFFLADDYVIDTPDWPRKIRTAVTKLPNGIGVLFPHDDLHPDHAAFPITTRRMKDALGFYVPPCYPYWFVDTHMDHLGLMCGQHHEIDVVVRAPEGRGKSHALIDLPFWVRFFHEVAPIRMREAAQLIAAANGEGTKAFTVAMRGLPERAHLCTTRTAHLSDASFQAHWGSNAASPPSPQYGVVKEYAERMMADLRKHAPRRPKIAIAVPSGRTWEAASASSIAAMATYSAMGGIDCAFINTQSSAISHGRNTTVDIALKESVDGILWIDSDIVVPPDALVRLLRHGKAIVGALYNRRTPNAAGEHETLGALVAAPADPATGLYEAALIPGGCLFVATDVYRRLGFPWYGEAYDFPGSDRLAAFKALMRAYFVDDPGEDVLDTLDDTVFGDWLRDGYRVAQKGETCSYFSEDNWFIRRAIRAGVKPFVDIELSADIGHLGTAEICLKLPPEYQRGTPYRRVSHGGMRIETGTLGVRRRVVCGR